MFKLLARMYGWLPEQVSTLTVAQIGGLVDDNRATVSGEVLARRMREGHGV